MREIRIYQPGEYRSHELIELTPEAAHHVGVVLRMQVGASITVFNGKNEECQAVIYAVKKKQVTIELGTVQCISRESPLHIHLGQAISKGDRMDWVVQKSVELGVATITPLITQHCAVKLDKERLEKKVAQWQAIAIAACEQCGRNTIPIINKPLNLEGFLAMATAPLKFILDPRDNKSWRDYHFPALHIDLIIGPEGGLSEDEVQLALQHHFLPLSLGPRILRTETAAISALSVLQAVGGDL